MVKIHDIRYRTQRTNGTRKLSQVKNVVRHHSATATGNFDTFWKHWHGTRGWGTGGYHEIILRDGFVELCYGPEEITNGVANTNSKVYNICLVGNGSFTAEQERVFDIRAKAAMKLLNLPVSAVKGHGEFPGSITSCPGINMDSIRKRLSGSEVVQVSKPVTKPKPTPKPTPKLSSGGIAVDGYWGPATTRALQFYFKTPVDGVISGQYRNVSTLNISSVEYGTSGSLLIKAIQRWLGVKQDGWLGPITVRALQRKLGTPQDGVISSPSIAVKELQRRLNNGKL